MSEYSNFPIRPWTGSPPMSSSLLFSSMCNKCLTNMQYPYVYAEAIAPNTYTGYILRAKRRYAKKRDILRKYPTTHSTAARRSKGYTSPLPATSPQPPSRRALKSSAWSTIDKPLFMKVDIVANLNCTNIPNFKSQTGKRENKLKFESLHSRFA